MKLKLICGMFQGVLKRNNLTCVGETSEIYGFKHFCSNKNNTYQGKLKSDSMKEN